MQIGQTSDLVQNADMSRFTDRVKINEGINTHRVLNGPFLMRSVYWPTFVNEQGQMVQRMRSVLIPKTGSELLKSLASTEKEFRTTMGEKDARSQFTPSNLYMYLIFNRDEITPKDELPKVRVAAYKQTVYNRLIEIQNERSTKDQNKLKNGLIFMYDIQVKKTIEDKARPRFTTKYTVDVDTENNKVQGAIPAELLDMSTEKMMKILEENKIWEAIFTKDELKAINESELDLATETKPNTEEEILHKLKENPIFLGAKDGNTGQFLFPQNEQFMIFLKSKELPILESAAQTQLPPQQEQTTQVDIKTEEVKTTGSPLPTQPEVISQKTETESTSEVKTENGTPIIRWGEK